MGLVDMSKTWDLGPGLEPTNGQIPCRRLAHHIIVEMQIPTNKIHISIRIQWVSGLHGK